MDDHVLVMCPYCGEHIEMYLEPDIIGSFVLDCEVCCQPWLVRVSRRGEKWSVHVGRADGAD
jgi:hypothetical protein